MWVRSTANSLSVCESVCLSVYPRAYLWNRWNDLHEILCADPLWLWLGPPPAVLRYAICFWFYGWYYLSSVAIPGQSLISTNALLLLQQDMKWAVKQIQFNKNVTLSAPYQCFGSLPSCRGSQSELAQAACHQVHEAEKKTMLLCVN